MKLVLTIPLTIVGVLLLSTVTPVSSQEISRVVLPVEVLGSEGSTEERSLSLTSSVVDQAERLWLQVNNLSYEDKGSIQINEGAWLSLNHQTVTLQRQEAARGGMVHGGFSTIRFSVPVSNLQAGRNTLRFRFNTSDGISNGYRVVQFNLLDTSGNQLLPASTFVEDDPTQWRPPLGEEANIREGERLWKEATLWSSYSLNSTRGFWYGYQLPEPSLIQANCSSCHTQDGRDLELFSYSNKSIIERAKFHRLTERQGEQIASYIRSLSSQEDGIGRYGRPWNPPYQPGPQLKGKPIEQWAAGAGLDAVLDDDKDMLPYLFPNGVNQAEVYKHFDSDKLQNQTEIPLAIQLPDWKHWLPIIHPMDAYTKNDFWNSPTEPDQFNPQQGYQDFRDYLETNPPQPQNRKELMAQNGKFWFHYRGFLVQGTEQGFPHWRTPDGNATKSLGDDVPRELAATSLARLMAVQFFEIMNEFNLQDKASWFGAPEDHGPENVRQWFGENYQVFEVPAHFQACVEDGAIIGDCDRFFGQPKETGQYESTVWYHLQLILNGGNGMMSHNSPVDNNYHPEYIMKASRSSGIYEPVRYYHSLNHMYQTRTWSGAVTPNDGKGFRMRIQGPWYFLGKEADDARNQFHSYEPGEWPKLLDEATPGLTRWVLNAQFRQFLKEVNKPENDLSTWNRIDDQRYDSDHERSGSNNLDSKSKDRVRDVTENFAPGTLKEGPFFADHMYWAIPEAYRLGADCQVLQEVVDWCEEAWPLIDFEKFRGMCEEETTCDTDIEDRAVYRIKTQNDKAVDVAEYSLADGGNVYQWTPHQDDNQKWQIIAQGNGYYMIKSLHSGKCLDVSNVSDQNGANVHQWNCDGRANQQWKLNSLGDCTYSLTARHSGKCLDLYKGREEDGANLQQWYCHPDSKNQRFIFEYVEGEMGAGEAVVGSMTTLGTPEGAGLIVFPNPARSEVRLKMPATPSSDGARIQLYDMSGRLMMEQRTQYDVALLNTRSLAPGSYLIKVASNNFRGATLLQVQ